MFLLKNERLTITEFTPDMAQAVHENSLDEDNRRFVPDEVFETVEEQLVKIDTSEITGYIWYGSTMNELYQLSGDNQYQDDLPFLCFDNKCFNGSGNLNVFKLMVGARWLDDIVCNNSIQEEKK